jgi:GntR family transcriptional regulator/MocR family aminotransferase
VAVDRRLQTPLYAQIYSWYRSRILSGELPPGHLVPSSRELARDLRISRLPVLNAYDQLLAEGFFETRVGTGTFISQSLALPARAVARQRSRDDSRSRRISAHAMALPQYETAYWTELGAFQVGQPALDQFPLVLWSKLVARCARKLSVNGLRYGDATGLHELREVIANYLRAARGVRCDTRQVIIVSGSQQALDLATRVLLDQGAPVWIEDPGYWLARHVLKGAGCLEIPVPVDADGLNVSEGISRCRTARAAFVAPSHQFPLGVTMSATRRLQLLGWAQDVGAWIVEDDYDSEYRFDSMPISSLQGLDANARVIYVGTFSKVLFPSLRVGYIVVPGDLVERFVAFRQMMDLCPPEATQQALAVFIRAGHFARHVRRMRKLYAERREVLLEELQRGFGDVCTIVGAEAGMHVTVLIRGVMRDRDVAAKARREGLQLSPLSLSYAGTETQQGFVLGFGNASVDQIAEGVHRLKKCLRR